MNKITLKGVLSNIRPSHKIKDVEYDQAYLLVTREDGREDNLSVKFKKFCNPYKENDIVELTGNIRSFSQKLDNGKNKVSLYVFTYFDIPNEGRLNEVVMDGRICKKDILRTTKNGKNNIHFILANNLIIEETNQKLNSYIPCIAWGKLAKQIEKLSINDKILINGELHSREYKKVYPDGHSEFKVAHECVINSFEII